MQAFLPIWFDRFTAKTNSGNTYTLGGMADSYYEYLLKVWLLQGKQVCACLNCTALTLHKTDRRLSCSCTSSFLLLVACEAAIEVNDGEPETYLNWQYKESHPVPNGSALGKFLG